MDPAVKMASVGTRGQPRMMDTASAAAMSRTLEPARRVMKKKIEAVVWLARPKRTARNS